jgi:hypothetical protein
VELDWHPPPEFSSDFLQLHFEDGKQLGINRDKMRVFAKFKSNKPISFTTKLEFRTDGGQFYTIYCSGTTDNCLLSNFSFFLRVGRDYTFTAEKGKPVRIEPKDNENDSQVHTPKNQSAVGNAERRSVNFSRAGSITSKSARSSLGYSPIPFE